MTPRHVGTAWPASVWGAARALILGSALLLSCRGTGTIVIGLAGPFTDPRGVSMEKAAQLAVAQINRAGGVSGRSLALRIVDDRAQSARAILVAESLRTDPSVVAVIGHLTSAPTLAAAAVYNSSRDPVVELSPSASSPELSGIGPYTFRVCATDLAHGPALARFAYDRLRVTHVAVIYQNDDYGRGLVAAFRDEFMRLGGTVDEQDPVLGPATDPTPYLDRIRRDRRAGAIMLAADRATASVSLRILRGSGMKMPVLGGDALTGIQDEGPLAEGVYVSSSWLPDTLSSASAAFVRTYRSTYSGDLPDHRGAGAYDAVHLIADAIAAGAGSRDAVRDYLASLGAAHGPPPYDGVTGRIQFDSLGDVRNKGIVVGVVRRGRIVPVESR